jgi:hypothetical protein
VEQIPAVAQRYARKTNRLKELYRQVAFEMSGEGGKRVLSLLNLPISGDGLLALVKQVMEKTQDIPRVLGVDDWAMRKGQRDGTLLVDLEQHRPIDLLPDREPQTVADWLKARPGIEIISRDRGKMYIDGATQWAPDALQVADRFHLLVNLQETLKRIFASHPGDIRTVKKEFAAILADDDPVKTNDPASVTEKQHVVVPRDRQGKAQGAYRAERFQARPSKRCNNKD